MHSWQSKAHLLPLQPDCLRLDRRGQRGVGCREGNSNTGSLTHSHTHTHTQPLLPPPTPLPVPGLPQAGPASQWCKLSTLCATNYHHFHHQLLALQPTHCHGNHLHAHIKTDSLDLRMLRSTSSRGDGRWVSLLSTAARRGMTAMA